MSAPMDQFLGIPAPAEQPSIAAPAADGAAAADAGKGKGGRNVKTPLQKEVLEASYAINPMPNLQHRQALAERIGLTEEQVNSWFTGKRSRDRKKLGGTPAPATGAGTPATAQAPAAAVAAVTPAESDQVGFSTPAPADSMGAGAGYTSGFESDAYGGSTAATGGAAVPAASAAGSFSNRQGAAAGSGGGISAVTAELLEAAKKTLPVPFREDGPPLAFVFDSVPAPNTKKGMQAAALIAAKRKKLGATPGEGAAAAAPGEVEEQGAAKKPRLMPAGHEAAAAAVTAAPIPVDDPSVYQQALQQQAALHASSTAAQVQSGRVLMKAERERQKEEQRRQKEMEKARAAQEREAKKREAQQERERRAEEKRKAAEDKRREKELAKALLQQERAAGRGARTRGGGEAHHHHGPPDDLELEQEALMIRARATAAAQAAARGLDPSAVEPVVGPPPEFPPPYLLLQPAFPPELGDDLGPQLIEAWGFVTGFCDLLGIPAFSMEALLSALLQGSSSPLLGLVHILLLRQAQTDMEEAHATGVLQSPQIHLMDRTLVAAAQRLEEAWAWGLDPDLWRAHLNPTTWPEVLRQQALAAGAGGSRFHLKPQPAADGGLDGSAAAGSAVKAKRGRAPRGAVGFEGEDVLVGVSGDAPLKLQLPDRFGHGTWMAAAWRVLAEAGPEGMNVAELVRIIAERKLRSLVGSKNPEASLTGALSRDILFHRIKPGTYALQSIVTYHQRMQAAGKPTVVEPVQDTQRQAGAGAMAVDGQDDSDDEEESDEEEAFARAPEDPADSTVWAITLKHQGYDALTLAQRLDALLWLVGVVNEGPGVRMKIDAREKEVAALKKQLQEDAKAEKKRRQDEAAARARAAAEQAQARLEELQRQQAAGESVAPEAMAAAAQAAAALSAAAGIASAPGAASRAVTPAPAGTATAGPTAGAETGGAAAAAAPAAQADPAVQQQQQQQQQQGEADGQTDAQQHQPQEKQAVVAVSQSPEVQKQQQSAPLPPLPPGQQQEQQPRHSPTPDAHLAELEAELAAESARRAARAEAIRRCEELNVMRLEPLGMDRRHNRYWLLVCPDFAVTSAYCGVEGDVDAAGNKAGSGRDANAGRIYVEPAKGCKWRVMLRTQQLDQLKQVLEPRGLREGVLHQSLLRVEHMVRAAMPGTPFAMPKAPGQQSAEQQQAAHAATAQWLASQPLLATTLTSSAQEAEIADILAAAAAAAPGAADAGGGDPNKMEVVIAADGAATAADEQCITGPAVLQLKRDMLRVEVLLADAMQHSHFHRQAWVQDVASAPSLTALKSCLVQLEHALATEGQPHEERGKKTRGQIKAESERIPLLSPAWNVLASTPCVKGAWLSCSGAEVPAAVIGSQGLLEPVQLAQPAAAPAATAATPDAGADPAAEAAAQQQQCNAQLQRQQQHHAADLSWLPATVPALSLRLAALDAVLQYPQLGPQRMQLYGRETMARYRYIVKPAPIYAPPTLDQLLSQEEAVSKQISVSTPAPADSTTAQPRSHATSDSAKQETNKLGQQQGNEQSPVRQPQQSQDAEKKHKQQQVQQWQDEHLSGVPSLQEMLGGPVRVVYGYSLAGRGLLQLIRGLPPYPDWTQQARLEEFSIPVEAYQKAVEAAQADGTFGMTIPEIRAAKEAEAARAKAEEEARRAAKAAAKEAAVREAAAAAEAAAAVAGGKGHTVGDGKAALPPKSKAGLKIKLSGQAAAAVAAKQGKPAAAATGHKDAKLATAAAAGKGDSSAAKEQQQHEKKSANGPAGAAAVAPKLRIKGGKPLSREQSRESSPAGTPKGPAATAAGGSAKHAQQKPVAAAQQKQPVQQKSRGLQKTGAAAAAAAAKGAGGTMAKPAGGGRLTGRLRLRQSEKPPQKVEDEVDEELMDSSEDDD